MRTRLPLVIAPTSVLVVVGALIVALPTASGTPARTRPACTITGTNGDDEIHGTSGPDLICARGGDFVRGRGGDDVLLLGPGKDYGDGDAGNDRIFGGAGRDVGEGGRGEDRIFLQRGGDFAQDVHGADRLFGGPRSDCLETWDNKGNDRALGGPGRDRAGADAGDVVRSAEFGPTVSCGDEEAP